MSLRPGLPRAIAGRDATAHVSTAWALCWRRRSATIPAPISFSTCTVTANTTATTTATTISTTTTMTSLLRPAARRLFSTATVRRSGAVAGAKRRGAGAFGKDFFGKNGLGEGFWMARGVQSFGVEGRGGATAATTTTTPIGKREGGVEGEEEGEVLPHRRRKRAREIAAVGGGGGGSAAGEGNAGGDAYPIPLDASARLADLATTQTSLKRLFFTYLSLSKPRLSFLVVLTATATYSLYPVPQLLSTAATATPSLSALTLLFLTTGTALCSASANAFNMLMEPKYDAQMSRTRNRPLVRKLISPRGAILFAVACGLSGTAALFYGVNPTTAGLGFANIILYAAVYTPLKRISVLNTWVGAVVGGLPPLMGWTAAASQYAHDGTASELLFGPGSAGGWLCAALLFAWQFPHFNALSWSIRDEYRAAGYRMLAWVNPAHNARVALRYALLMFPICIALSLTGVTDPSYIATSSAVNGWMAWKAWAFYRAQGHHGTARALFWASVWHLPIVMVLAMAQKKGLGERLYRSVVGYPDIDEDDLYYETVQPRRGRGVEV